jgi:hypothetical protein
MSLYGRVGYTLGVLNLLESAEQKEEAARLKEEAAELREDVAELRGKIAKDVQNTPVHTEAELKAMFDKGIAPKAESSAQVPVFIDRRARMGSAVAPSSPSQNIGRGSLRWWLRSRLPHKQRRPRLTL